VTESGPNGCAGAEDELSVLLVVLTFRRPETLLALLPLLTAQAAAINRSGSAFKVDVLVVDNDPAGSGHPVVRRCGQAVRYVCEERVGIAAARNRALAEAADHDLLVFIDDDERPDVGWLSALLEAYARFRPAGVTGPVHSHWDGSLHPWVSASGLFDRHHRKGLTTGDPVDVAASNNLLLDLAVVRRHRLAFAEWLRLSGGEDSLFTQTLTRLGETLVWCDEASVTELLSSERMTPRYVLRLSFSHGNTAARINLASSGGRTRWWLRARLSGQGAARVAAGLGDWLVGLTTSSLSKRAVGARTASRGLGMLMGAFGYRYQQYKRSS
jgi:succinoglycan biosynthesis protein ExoM